MVLWVTAPAAQADNLISIPGHPSLLGKLGLNYGHELYNMGLLLGGTKTQTSECCKKNQVNYRGTQSA